MKADENGQSDVTAGVVLGRADLLADLEQALAPEAEHSTAAPASAVQA